MTASEQVIQVLDEICKKFGLAIDWSKDNILPYVQELGQKIVRYDLAMSILGVILSIIGFILIGIFLKRLFKEYKEREKVKQEIVYYLLDRYGDLTGMGLTLFIVCGVIGFLSLIGLIMNVPQIIQDLTFPELTILEFIKPYLQ